MRSFLAILVATLTCNGVAATADATQGTPAPLVTPGKLQIEIYPPAAELDWTGADIDLAIEGMASAIGGVKHLDIMMVMDTSMSLRRSDPEDFRSAGAIGLIESLSPKSDTQIGVVGFDGDSELTQPLTADRRLAIVALQDLKQSGGTDIAAGIQTALAELERNGRPGSSRVIMLFTDGMSNKRKALQATAEAKVHGVAIQTLLLGENLKGARILDEIAGNTGGSFVWVTDPSKLPEAFLNLRTTGVDTVTLSVNGSEPLPTQLTGGTFSARVPLTVGENHIVATATSLDEQIEQSSVTVKVRDASCAALAVNATSNGQPALSLNDRAVQIVVDASRSMWGQIDGKAKMTIAQEILDDAATWLPDDLDLSLRAYGNASPSHRNDCADSSLLVPFASVNPVTGANRFAIRSAVAALKPLGQTPIAYALKQAAGDFASLESERSLVLVTDGIESCNGDPVAAARELRSQGITIHVIGFGLGNTADEDTSGLRAIAEVSGGQFVTANSAAELRRALESSVATRYRVVQENVVVARSVLGAPEPVLLPKGDYRVELDSVPPHQVQVSLAPRDTLRLTLEKHNGVVSHSQQRAELPATFCQQGIAARASSRELTKHIAPKPEPGWE